ncbi:MAG: hypothetical protein DRR06_01500 [Gammaproteobacteria bacterium]|nr:MAG: hypothetical protein DRR06_01500 [Gammaproteobacteria bacterium]RLA54878.1 MAG: hypothetical protein DRR42_00550 [Gammaproteobacteria bacterium]
MEKDSASNTVEEQESGSEQKPEEVSAPVENNAPQQQAKSGVSKAWRWFTLLLILLLVGLAGAAAWFGFQYQQHAAITSGDNAQQAARVAVIEQKLTTEQFARSENELAYTEKLAALQRDMDAQAEAITKLSTLDRDQLFVAELEYLIRLANQRLLTERRPQGAQTLLEAADKLLATVDDVHALAVREVLAKDIAALRMVETVDREGIYSRLGALAPTILSLSALPSESMDELVANPGMEQSDTEIDYSAVANSSTTQTTWYKRLWVNAQAALSRFSRDHFHVRYRQVPIESLLSTEQEQWLRHDMLINLANAQQALLREEQQIYNASLTVIESRLQDYFTGSYKAQALIGEIQALRTLDIRQQLPDISGSADILRQMQTAQPAVSVGGGGGL